MSAVSAAIRPMASSRSTISMTPRPLDDAAIEADRTGRRRRASCRHHLGPDRERSRTGRAQPCRGDRRRTCHPRSIARIEPDSATLSTLTLSSFAALAVSVVPWLIFGNTLALHQPFDPGSFRAQRRSLGCATVIVPGPLVAPLAQAGQSVRARMAFATSSACGARPSGCRGAPAWRESRVGLIDVQVFGEIGLVAAGARSRRSASRHPVRCGHGCPAQPTETRRPWTSSQRPPARSRCAGRWCRLRPSRPAPNAATIRISRSRPAASSIPDMPAGRTATPWW